MVQLSWNPFSVERPAIPQQLHFSFATTRRVKGLVCLGRRKITHNPFQDFLGGTLPESPAPCNPGQPATHQPAGEQGGGGNLCPPHVPGGWNCTTASSSPLQLTTRRRSPAHRRQGRPCRRGRGLPRPAPHRAQKETCPGEQSRMPMPSFPAVPTMGKR